MTSIVSNWISIYKNWALWRLFVVSTHLSNNFNVLADMSQLFPFLIYSSNDVGFSCEYLFSLLHSLRGRRRNVRERGQVFASEKRERKEEGAAFSTPSPNWCIAIFVDRVVCRLHFVLAPVMITLFSEASIEPVFIWEHF